MKLTPMKPRQLLMMLIVSVALLGATTKVHAATYNAVNSGDFSDAATFSPVGTPGSGDTVVVSNNVTLTISDARTISVLTVGRSGGSGSVLIISSSGSLTVSGQYGFAGTAPVINNDGTFSCGGGATFSTGALNNNGTATFSGNAQAFNGGIAVTQGANATLNLTAANSTPFGGSTTLAAGAAGNTVSYTTGQNMRGTTYYHLSVSGTSPSAGSATTINGTLTINLNAGQQINSAGNITFGSGANIIRTRGALNGTPIFSGPVNVTYNGAAAMTTGSELPTAANRLNNLTIAATASVTLNANATVNGAFAATYNGSTVPLIAGTRTLAFVNSPVNITVTGSALTAGNSYTIVSSSGTTVSGALGLVSVTGVGAPYSAGPTASTGTGQLVLTIPNCTSITATPTITAPIYAGATSISGTSVSGASIGVYDLTSATQIGTTTASGTSWTATVTPLIAGHLIAATALAPGDDCASPNSASVAVQNVAPPSTLSLVPVADTNINAGIYLTIPIKVLTNGVPAN
jgi:fibronectin-binding autotransporter adhesin